MSERARLTPLPLVAGALVAALALIPFGYVLAATIEMGWSQFQELLFRPRVGELLTNTSMLLLGTLTITVVLGVSARPWPWSAPTCRSRCSGTRCSARRSRSRRS